MLTVTFTLTAPATVRVRIEREGRWIATPFVGDLSPGPQSISWNGTRAAGTARDGSYTAAVDVQDASGTSTSSAPFTLDTRAPRVRILAGRRLRIEVDEPATLAIRVDGVLVRREVRRAGAVRIPWANTYSRVSVVATDAAGNRSPPAVSKRPRSGQAGQ